MKDKRFLTEQPRATSRRVNRYSTRQRFLIVCEGEKTEPNYFRKFPIPPDSIVEVTGLGENTVSLVRTAIKLRTEAKYDQVWCVFDRDSFPPQNFNAALKLARNNNIEVAYSNEAFELWYLLHFCYLNSGITRDQYRTRLERYLGHAYAKNSETIFDEMYPRQKEAIQNARRLYNEYDPHRPLEDNPSTTVFLLAEMLNQLFWD